MLLLAGAANESDCSRIGKRLFDRLQTVICALGLMDDGKDTEVDGAVLCDLGCNNEEAALILRLLDGTAAITDGLTEFDRMGVQAVTRISTDYPLRIRQCLSGAAPLVLYCSGDTALFQTACVSLVGSRKLREPGLRFAKNVGQMAARKGYTLVSGGAAGADQAAYESCMNCGGKAILFLADSIAQWQNKPEVKEYVRQGRLLLVSEDGADYHFTASRAMRRNRLIHAMGKATFVAQSDYGSGGTWGGTVENLKHEWSPVLVSNLEPDDPGFRGLVDRGAEEFGIELLETFSLDCIQSRQTSLFE